MKLCLVTVVWISVPCLGHSVLHFNSRKGKYRHSPKEMQLTNVSGDPVGQKQQNEVVEDNLGLTGLSSEKQEHKHQQSEVLDEDSNSSANADLWNGGLRHRPVRDRYSASPLLLLYTTSGSEAHADALCLSAEFMNRKGISDPLKYADIIVDVNSGTVEQQYKMEGCLKMFPNTYTRLTRNNANAGYRMGAIQAVDSEVNEGIARDYEWIIHLHPDKYIVDDSQLLTALKNTSASAIASSWSCPQFPTDLLTFSFFAFRPDRIAADAFQKWHDFADIPEKYLKEVAFRKNMENGEVMIVPGPGMVPPCKREMDGFGFWHSHDVAEVLTYLDTHPSHTY